MVLTTDGEFSVVKQSPAKYEELRRYDLSDGETWAHPVPLKDAVFIRDAKSLALWSLR